MVSRDSKLWSLLVLMVACARAPAPMPHENVALILNSSGVVGVILPLHAGQKLLLPCTRSRPKSVEASWRPDPELVERFERLLPALVASHKTCFTKDRTPNLKHYIRQYGGFVRDGQRVIYANFIHSTDYLIVEQNSWQWSATGYCDGGHEYFGIEFNADTSNFTALEFDAEYSGSVGPCASIDPAALQGHEVDVE